MKGCGNIQQISGRRVSGHDQELLAAVDAKEELVLGHLRSIERRLPQEAGFGLRETTRQLPAAAVPTGRRRSRQQRAAEGAQEQYHRCKNLDGVFKIKEQEKLLQGPVLLVDDIVRSSWTVTNVASLLRQQGSGPVFPVALALIGTED